MICLILRKILKDCISNIIKKNLDINTLNFDLLSNFNNKDLSIFCENAKDDFDLLNKKLMKCLETWTRKFNEASQK